MHGTGDCVMEVTRNFNTNFGTFGHLSFSLIIRAKIFQFEEPHSHGPCSLCIRLISCLSHKPKCRAMSFLGQNLAGHRGHVLVLGKEVGHAK